MSLGHCDRKELLDTFTLELVVSVVAVSGIVAGISVSLALRSRRSTRAINQDSGAASESGEGKIKTTIQSAIDFHEFTLAQTPSAVSKSSSQGELQIGPSGPLVSGFQSKSSKADISSPPSLFKGTTTAEAKTPNESCSIFESERESSEYKGGREEITEPKEIQSEIGAMPSATADSETVFKSPSKEESFASTPSSMLAVPTDSVALENISPTLLPIQGQTVTSSTAFSSAANSNYGNAPNAYCVKCKSKKQIRDPSAVTMKNGRPAISGFCCDCGTRVFRIGRLSISNS